MKLSAIQTKVIKLMREGWELLFNRWNMKPPYLGLNKKTLNVYTPTLKILLNNELIRNCGIDSKACNYYELTEKGKVLKI